MGERVDDPGSGRPASEVDLARLRQLVAPLDGLPDQLLRERLRAPPDHEVVQVLLLVEQHVDRHEVEQVGAVVGPVQGDVDVRRPLRRDRVRLDPGVDRPLHLPRVERVHPGGLHGGRGPPAGRGALVASRRPGRVREARVRGGEGLGVVGGLVALLPQAAGVPQLLAVGQAVAVGVRLAELPGPGEVVVGQGLPERVQRQRAARAAAVAEAVAHRRRLAEEGLAVAAAAHALGARHALAVRHPQPVGREACGAPEQGCEDACGGGSGGGWDRPATGDHHFSCPPPYGGSAPSNLS
mmetsp:Transcript_121198/g.343370  ORF Transcript_121198/g.343370 Transcript_121198/m.343370 type:complete len:296 (+) Transcript_121198:747-1634(+)